MRIIFKKLLQWKNWEVLELNVQEDSFAAFYSSQGFHIKVDINPQSQGSPQVEDLK